MSGVNIIEYYNTIQIDMGYCVFFTGNIRKREMIVLENVREIH